MKSFNNKSVLLTGLLTSNKQSISLISQMGGKALDCAMIQTEFLSKNVEFLELKEKIIITSPTAAIFFFRICEEYLKIKIKTVKGIIPIGIGTSKQLKKMGFCISFESEKSGNIASFKASKNVIHEIQNKEILLPCSVLADKRLEEFLMNNGSRVSRVNIYNIIPAKKKLLPHFEYVVFFSPSAVVAMFELYGKNSLQGKKIATIGERTAIAVKKYFSLDVFIAKKFTVEATLNAFFYY